jgi:hypothetical protein
LLAYSSELEFSAADAGPHVRFGEDKAAWKLRRIEIPPEWLDMPNSQTRVKSALEFCASGYISLPLPMKISTDDQRAIGVIMVCVGVLCFLIGLAGHLKENYHFRGEISATGFTAAAVLAGIGIILFLFSFRKKRG